VTEVATHYNYFRDYDPAIGRYVQSDPIGLRGGISTFGYVGGSPLDRFDLRGLETYMCTGKLHALTKKFSDRFSQFAHDHVPFAHHQWLCVKGADGKMTCGGQDQRGKEWYDPIRGEGRRSRDDFDENTCTMVEREDRELENCLLRKIEGPRPPYGIPFGTDCQEWSDQVLRECKAQTKASRELRRRGG